MSRGWESKSVDEQMREQEAEAEAGRVPHAAGRPADRLAEAHRTRQVQALELQRERVLSERTSSPHRRTALEMALADLEARLTELGWTVHL